MLNRLQTLVIRVSQTWWLYLFVVLLFAGSLLSLLRIGGCFRLMRPATCPSTCRMR